ncbi:MAG: cation:proton antiporter [Pseudomonadales bacterium]|nr:cation:proton antiporter [Pseudomonadales bacterium]
MHNHIVLIFAASLVFTYGLFSKLSERSIITGPMVFVLVGLLVSPLGLSLFEIHPNANIVKLAAELTLIIILFVDASMIDLDALKQDRPQIATRLLGVGLPLTMIAGTLVAYLLFPQLSIWMILLIALILSPTDAALGQAVIKNVQVPAPLRRAISVESGLNDGIALPPILFCIAALSTAESHQDGGWLWFMFKQLTLGPLVGALFGFVGGRLVDVAAKKGWMEGTFQRLACIPIAILTFAGAEAVGGNGFIAAFFAGLFLGIKNHDVRERVQEYGEAQGMQLSLLLFFMFGVVLLPAIAPYVGMVECLYAILSLTVIRMLPVALSLTGAKIDVPTILYAGWFGPRGIASLLYLLIVVTTLGFEGYEQMVAVISLTILLSVFAHGISAVPFTNRFTRTAP